jgi:hypothetical protein
MVSEAELVVAAWGSARLSDDARKIADWIGSIEKTHWLGFNKDGSPKHPLYVSKESTYRHRPHLSGSNVSGIAARAPVNSPGGKPGQPVRASSLA